MYAQQPLRDVDMWAADTGHLPPSSEIPLEALNFGDAMLDDFGAALAQAEDLGSW